MRKALMVLAVGVFVLGGAAIAVAQTDEDEPTPLGRIGSVIQEVLDELVADTSNGFTQEDADLVIEALTEKREELRAERQALRAQLEEFWSDGQLTQDEIDQLPENHPWRQLPDVLEDGVITRDELQSLRPFGRGHRHGGFGFGGPGADSSDS
jgi:hypothetical protein